MRKGFRWLLVGLLALAAVPAARAVRLNPLPDYNKHQALLRLEDVGPGGYYGTLDDLGRLRAILSYLEGAGVPFAVSVIPRNIEISPDGTRTDQGIDDPQPSHLVAGFVQILQDAQRQGAVLGMHGYTHQYGDSPRPDNWQNSGTGYELDVPGVPATSTPAFAADRITQGLAAFRAAGLTPAYWESPHYHDTRAQEEILRDFYGILFQPDFRSLRSLWDLNVYEGTNTSSSGATTLGSVYVPAPLKYISSDASVDAVLGKLDGYRGLAAVYFHPFLEFPYLEPVLEANGSARVVNGLPLYRYKTRAPSKLHRLVEGVEQHRFTWLSLHQVIPFTPDHRLVLPPPATAGSESGEIPAANLLAGKVQGLACDNLVLRRPTEVDVLPGCLTFPRNSPQGAWQAWLTEPIPDTDRLVLADINADGRADLVRYSPQNGQVVAYLSDGDRFGPAQPLGVLPADLQQLWAADVDGDGRADLVLQQGSTLLASRLDRGRLDPAAPVLTLPKGAQVQVADLDGDGMADVVLRVGSTLQLLRGTGQDLDGPSSGAAAGGSGSFVPAGSLALSGAQAGAQWLLRDTNGDGRADLILYQPDRGLWTVLQSDGHFGLQPMPNAYGPWARDRRRQALAADLDGNGKADIIALAVRQKILDVSLSFQPRQ